MATRKKETIVQDVGPVDPFDSPALDTPLLLEEPTDDIVADASEDSKRIVTGSSKDIRESPIFSALKTYDDRQITLRFTGSEQFEYQEVIYSASATEQEIEEAVRAALLGVVYVQKIREELGISHTLGRSSRPEKVTAYLEAEASYSASANKVEKPAQGSKVNLDEVAFPTYSKGMLAKKTIGELVLMPRTVYEWLDKNYYGSKDENSEYQESNREAYNRLRTIWRVIGSTEDGTNKQAKGVIEHFSSGSMGKFAPVKKVFGAKVIFLLMNNPKVSEENKAKLDSIYQTFDPEIRKQGETNGGG